MKKISDVVKHYESLGYSCLSRAADGSRFGLLDKHYSHLLTVIEKDNSIMVQVSVTINKFMGEVKSWEFNFPNPNIDKAIAQILEIRRSVQL